MKHTKDELKAFAFFKKDAGLSRKQVKAYRALNHYYLNNKQNDTENEKD